MKNIIMAIRRLLINFGKAIPFILCLIVFVSYFECLIALLTNNFVMYEYFAIPHTPISYFIASIFEYDWLTIIAITILCYSIETCKWNKLCIVYLALQLAFKNHIADFEFEITHIYIICITNIIISGFFCYKGIRLLI